MLVRPAYPATAHAGPEKDRLNKRPRFCLSRASKHFGPAPQHVPLPATMGFYDEIVDANGAYKYYCHGEWKVSSSGATVGISNPSTMAKAFDVQGGFLPRACPDPRAAHRPYIWRGPLTGRARCSLHPGGGRRHLRVREEGPEGVGQDPPVEACRVPPQGAEASRHLLVALGHEPREVVLRQRLARRPRRL